MIGSEPWVELIVSEHRSYLSRSRAIANAELAIRLEAASGCRVNVTHYLDVGGRPRPPAVVVLSGSVAPWATYSQESLKRLCDYVWAASVPTLGICAGMQLLATFAGGHIAPADQPEYGYHEVEILVDDDLFAGLGTRTVMYQEHTDHVAVIPAEFDVLGRSPICVQAFRWVARGWWGTQFHPERADARHRDGVRVLQNFFDLVLDRPKALQAPVAAAAPPKYGALTPVRRSGTGGNSDGIHRAVPHPARSGGTESPPASGSSAPSPHVDASRLSPPDAGPRLESVRTRLVNTSLSTHAGPVRPTK